MKNQHYGLPVIADSIKIQELKDSFMDFKSWAMVGEGRNMSGCFISTTKLHKMLEENKVNGNEPDGFKICFGINEIKEGDKSVERSLEIIVTAINFNEGQEDEGNLHTELTVYSTRPTPTIEPPVLKCPPLDCTITE